MAIGLLPVIQEELGQLVMKKCALNTGTLPLVGLHRSSVVRSQHDLSCYPWVLSNYSNKQQCCRKPNKVTFWADAWENQQSV